MKLLFLLDEKNYSDTWPVFEKYAVRAIIFQNGKYAMQRGKSGEYKIPGGTVETGESFLEALKREVLEETGLVLKPDSVKEIGEVTELREDLHKKGQKYICHSLFYHCEVEEQRKETKMTGKELEMGYQPVWTALEKILKVNRSLRNSGEPKRDTEFLKWWKENGEVAE